MNLIQVKEQIERLHELIERKATGTPDDLAQNLGVTDRTVRSYIRQLCELGAPIEYSRINQTYYYRHPVVFRFAYEHLDASTQKDNEGGVRGCLLVHYNALLQFAQF